MNYIVIDLEFNQFYPSSDTPAGFSNARCPFEIIQIGAVKLNEQFETIDTANFYIRPVIYKKLNPFVQEMVQLTIEDLEKEAAFPEVFQKFSDFIQGSDNVFCIWGSSDLKILFRNILYHKLSVRTVPKKYINVQLLAASYLKRPQGMAIGLKNAAAELKLDASLQFHNALNDAIYTAEIFRRVQNKNMAVGTFNVSILKLPEGKYPNKILESKLFDFVEAQLHRELSDVEKNAFIKVYNAGRTKLFDAKGKCKI